LADREAVSVTVTSNVKEPTVVGVPAIAPVVAPSVRPGGSAPPLTFHFCEPDGVAFRVVE
jgi:hypothetical protein